MAVVTFTSNASTGAGSLAEAIANAQPGDVIRPDETVFERGSTIEIALASTLNVDKNLTLDASPFRVVLNGDGLPRCCALKSGVSVEITAFDFIGGGWNSQTGTDVGNAAGAGLSVPGGTSGTLNRCGFFGCRGTYGGGIAVGTDSTAELNDCVIVGCYARGSGAGFRSTGDVVVNGSTIIGNIAAESTTAHDILVDLSSNGRVALINSVIGKYRGNVEVGSGCVVGVAPSALGFVAPPPDDLTPETWDANAWQSWNLRLLDDGSDAPSPYRDSGDVDAASKYDLDGNFRGRESEGVTTRSPGAYETIQADLFWVGVDSNGAEVVSPSFLTSDGWAASRFATVSGDAAPQIGRTVFVDGNVHFVDVLSTTSAKTFGLTVGGGAVAAIDAVSRIYFGKLQIALGASFTASASVLPKTSARCGAWSRINSQFVAELAPCDFDVKSYLANVIFYAVYIPTSASYGSLLVATSTVAVIRLSGEYVCDAFSTVQNGTGIGQTIRVGDDGATIRARQFKFGVDDASNYVESFFDRPVTLKLQGAASVSTPSTFRESWSDDFLVDVTDATRATLTLCGQTVCGDVPIAAVELSGSAKIDERGLDVASLALNADASLSVNGGSAKAATLTLVAGSTLTLDGASVCVAELSVADGATVAFSPVKAFDATDSANVIDETNATDKTIGTNATDGTAATYVDAILTATESATVGAATFAGCGYFATPQGTDASAATFETYVRRVDWSAGVETFAATATGPTTATLAWRATDATARVCVERENAAAPNGWEVVAVATAAESPLSVALSGCETFRIFDGATFTVDSAWFPTSAFYVYVAQAEAFDSRGDSRWEIVAHTTEAGIMGYRNEGRLFKARVRDKLNDRYLTPSDVESITATLYKVTKLWNGPSEWTPVAGRENFAVDAASVLEEPTLVDGWTLDEIGPNVLIQTPPDMFPEGGEYRLQATFRLTDGRDPVVVTFEAKVK